VWQRYTPVQRAARLGAQLALAAVTAWMLTRLGIRWDYVADAPGQIGDLVGRMFPPEWSFAGALVGPTLQTINIATVGTALAVVLSLPIAFLAALNTTFNRATYAAARGVWSSAARWTRSSGR
jgi:phosphonate transport system permease protein